MHDDIRTIKNSKLTQEQIDSLDGATVFDGEGLDDCIITVRVDNDGVIAVYDYDLLCNAFMDKGSSFTEEAQEWVDYNLVRALPYMRPRAPWIVMETAVEDVAEEFGEDVQTMSHDGRLYVRL